MVWFKFHVMEVTVNKLLIFGNLKCLLSLLTNQLPRLLSQTTSHTFIQASANQSNEVLQHTRRAVHG